MKITTRKITTVTYTPLELNTSGICLKEKQYVKIHIDENSTCLNYKELHKKFGWATDALINKTRDAIEVYGYNLGDGKCS
jgi:hypothetical protein